MSDSTWWYAQGDQRLGPVSWATLQSLATGGTMSRHTLVWAAGMAEWKEAHAVEGLAASFAEPPPLPHVPPPLPKRLTGLSCEIGDDIVIPARATSPAPAAVPAAPTVASQPLANYPRRMAATAIDMALVALPTVVLAGLVYPEYALWADNDVLSLKQIYVSLLPAIGYPLYQAEMLSKPKSATWGKQWLGLRVVAQDGERLSFWRALGRSAAQIYGLLTLGVGLLMPLWTVRRQAIHDKVASTLVVRVDADTPVPPVGAASGTTALQPWQAAALWLAVPLSLAPDLFNTLQYVLARSTAISLHSAAWAVATPVGERFAKDGKIPSLASVGVHSPSDDTVVELEDDTAIVTATDITSRMSISLVPNRPGTKVEWQCTLRYTKPVDLPFACNFRRTQ